MESKGEITKFQTLYLASRGRREGKIGEKKAWKKCAE